MVCSGHRDARGSKVKATDAHMQCLQKCLAGEQPPPTAVATAEVIDTPTNRVPARTQTLFRKYDTDGTGSLSYAEVSSALCEEFPCMPTYAREHLPVGFKQYAGSNDELDLAGFMKMHAGFLFRNFDVDANGVLELSEAEAALAYFANGQPTKIALPPAPDGVHVPEKLTVSKQWFWEMYKAMM